MVGNGDAIQFKFCNVFFQSFEAKIEMTVANCARNCVDVEVNFFQCSERQIQTNIQNSP